MSLFTDGTSFGSSSGDIWASGTFSFTSPINILLDKGNYTLSQLLNEDELLQEVKSYNGKVIEFLSTEAVISELVGFISDPINVNSTKERRIKFPYVVCEIFCCEVPSLLGVLVGPGGHFKRLFGVLNDPQNLDIRAVGYFEKVLMVLLKHKYNAAITWINDGGYNLFVKFLACLSSYSVMNILRRLLLPRNTALAEFEEGTITNYCPDDTCSPDISSRGSDTTQIWCNWGPNEQILEALLNCITIYSPDSNFKIDPVDGDCSIITCDENMRLIMAELLSSLISSCTAPQSSPLVRYILLPCTMEMIIAAISHSTIHGAVFTTTCDDNQPNSTTNLTLLSSTLAPLRVLYALVDSLVENEKDAVFQKGRLSPLSPRNVLNDDDTICTETVAVVFKVVPTLVNIISSCNDNEMDRIDTQNNEQIRRIGAVCLEAAKILSKLGELASWDGGVAEGVNFSSSSGVCPIEEKACNPSAAEASFISGLWAITLFDAFQIYPYCSFLHEAVCKFVETVVTSSRSRELQIHLVKDCHLLERLIEWGERKGSWPNNGHVQRMSVAVVLAQGNQSNKLGIEEVVLPFRDIMSELEDADPLRAEKWKTYVNNFVLPRYALEFAPLAECTILRGNGSAEVPLHFLEDPDSNMDDLAGIDVPNILEEDVLRFKEDDNCNIAEFPDFSRIGQEEEELVIDFSRSLEFDGGGVQGSQTYSNSGSLTGWANFPALDSPTEIQQQPIADFADFSAVEQPNPMDSLSSPSSVSNFPCTTTTTSTTVGDRTKEPMEDEITMASAARTVSFDAARAREVIATPSGETEECIGIKAKTI